MLSQESPTEHAHPVVQANDQADGLSTRDNAPNLIVIGAMKASSTTFYELISRHPQVWFSREKEPHYFTSTDYGDSAAWRRYLGLFEAAPQTAKYIGEASTGYSKYPHFGDTAQRLRDDLNDPQLIYLIRDPVKRTISNYRHAYLSGHYPAGTRLGEAIERDPILIDASCYARQIHAYRNVFEDDRLLILTTDQLHAEPGQVMRQVEAFLELDAFDGWEAPLPQSNSKQALGRSLALQSMLPKSLINVARACVPASLRERAKALAASKIEVPAVSDDERNLVFTRVESDLHELRSLVGDDIAMWPSAKRLGER